MAFPESHLYLTLHWEPANLTGETGQIGVRFSSPKAATQARVDACAAAARQFWATAATIPNNFALKYLRLARVGTDGRYSNASSFDYLFTDSAAGLLGGGSGVAPYPLQVACATTLTTAVPHGQASKGRIYLPPLPVALAADSQWTIAQTTPRSAAVAAFLASVGPILGGPAAVYSKGTVRSGAGLKRNVTGVKTGRRPDVQRRRAKGIVETYGTSSTVADVPRDAGPAEDLSALLP